MSGVSSISRRYLLGAAAGLAAASPSFAQPVAKGLKVAIFSKHLQFLQGEALANGAAEIGFDGVDLTVRKGGHVEPERVAQELPKIVAILRQHKLEVPMITTDIVDDASPNAEQVLRTCAELGIHHYRWGGLRYDAKRPIIEQLDAMKPRVAKLAALNKKYNTCAMYHTHSGIGVVGASIWDLHLLLKDFDPNAVSVNYDIGHATIEGGFGGWINSFHVTGRHMRGVAVKDVVWAKDASGAWKPRWVPLGQGMVHFPQFFGMLKESGFSGPLQIHYEYPLGGADSGKANLTISRDEVFAAMKRDLNQLRGYLKAANLDA
jgi:sugar phosphate isomerase/epimerase